MMKLVAALHRVSFSCFSHFFFFTLIHLFGFYNWTGFIHHPPSFHSFILLANLLEVQLRFLSLLQNHKPEKKPSVQTKSEQKRAETAENSSLNLKNVNKLQLWSNHGNRCTNFWCSHEIHRGDWHLLYFKLCFAFVSDFKKSFSGNFLRDCWTYSILWKLILGSRHQIRKVRVREKRAACRKQKGHI